MKRVFGSGNLTLLVLLFCFGLSATFSWAQRSGMVTVPADLVRYPELVVYNAKVVTMDDYEINTSVGTIEEAIAVSDGKIWKLGKNDEVLAYAGPETERIDAGGRTIIPGLINVHTHMHDYALNDWLDENPNTLAVKIFRVEGNSTEEIGRNLEVLMKERMADARPGQWAYFYLPNPPFGTGGGPGFDFLKKKMITKKEIDLLVPNNPVILSAHPSYIINTAAMEALQEIYGGKPGREDWDDDGFTYLGVEYRRQAVVDSYFNDKTEQLKEIVYHGLLGNVAAGFTTYSSHIMGIQNFDAYMLLYRENRMPIRFGFTHYTGFAVNDDPVAFYRRLGDMRGLGNDYFWFVGVGLGFIDHGPPLFCTNMVPENDKDMYEYCRDAPGTAFYNTIVSVLANGGRVVAGHNYGDKSADFFMDAIEEAMRRNPKEITLEHIRSLRLSMDHGGLYPRPDQLPRIKRLGMMLSMASQSMSRSFPWVEKYGFEKYQNWVVPVKRTLEAGIKVAWEGEGGYKDGAFSMIAPFLTRKNKQGVEVAPDQALDRNTVIKMATAWGSEFLLKEDKIGSLEPGKLADFVILNQDYFTIPLEKVERTYPLMTVLGGKIAFLRDEFAKTLGMEPVGRQIRYNFENIVRN